MTTTVLVHKGTEYFPYITDSIDQFYLFNPGEKLVLITDSRFAEIADLELRHEGFENRLVDELNTSRQHRFFLRWNRMKRSSFRGGFWRYAIERFFVLSDYMETTGTERVLHFEYDNLIYFKVSDLANAFDATSKGLSIPLDSTKRSVPAIVYVRDADAIKDFCWIYNLFYLVRKMNDMKALYLYSLRRRGRCSYLPVAPSFYREGRSELRSLEGRTTTHFEVFDADYDRFGGIFDPGAIGQYLGGVDPRNDPKSAPGFINESVMYSPSDFTYAWVKDEEGRLKPMLTYSGRTFPIFNLHIHSKALHKFRSDRNPMMSPSVNT